MIDSDLLTKNSNIEIMQFYVNGKSFGIDSNLVKETLRVSHINSIPNDTGTIF